MLEELQTVLFKQRTIERRDKKYLQKIIDDNSIPNRGLDTRLFGERIEVIKKEEIKEETEIPIGESICPRQLFDSKDWPGIHLSEIELNPEGILNGKRSMQKPPYSYAILIKKALLESKDGQLTLSAIYKWIKDNFSYYKTADPAWQNSIRHNLSLNKMFQKVKRPSSDPGKGGFWKINSEFQSPPVKNRREKENTRNVSVTM